MDQGALTCSGAGWALRKGRARPLRVRLANAFDDRDELGESRVALVAQKTIDGDRMIGVGVVQSSQRIVLDAMLLQLAQPVHHPVEGRLMAFVDAVSVVHRLRPVDADADEEVMLLEEGRPFIVDQRTVGLD